MSGIAFGITIVQLALLAYIAVIDLRQRTIHSGALLALAGFTLYSALANNSPVLQSALVGAILAGGAFSIAYLGGSLFAKQHELPPATIVFGRGDIWLGAVCGLAVGFPGSLVMVLLAMLLGGLSVGVFVAFSRMRGAAIRPFTILPYAQNIAVAAGFSLLFPAEVAQLLAA